MLIKTAAQANLLDQKIEAACAAMLPAYMMYAIGEKAKQAGLILRDDFFINIPRHMAQGASGLDEISVGRVSQRVDERARELLREISSDNPIAVLFVVMFAILKGVDEGVITDVTSQPVLYSVLLINESEDDGFETTFSKAWAKQKAGELFYRAYINKWL